VTAITCFHVPLDTSERTRSWSETRAYSFRNFVGTWDVVSTSSRDEFTYFTMVGMCPFVSFSLFCIMALMGSISFLMTCFHRS